MIGGLTPECAEKAAELYRVFCRGEIQLLATPTSAEMAKLAENSYRDVNIAYANELSMICDKLGLDVWEIVTMANHHPRVNILSPGPGVGGHCIAVDPWFLVGAAPDEAVLIRTARMVNDGKPHHVVSQVLKSAQPVQGPGDRLPRAVLQGQRRRHPRVARGGDRRRAAPQQEPSIDDHGQRPDAQRPAGRTVGRASRTFSWSRRRTRSPAADIVVLLVDHTAVPCAPAQAAATARWSWTPRGIWR